MTARPSPHCKQSTDLASTLAAQASDVWERRQFWQHFKHSAPAVYALCTKYCSDEPPCSTRNVTEESLRTLLSRALPREDIQAEVKAALATRIPASDTFVPLWKRAWEGLEFTDVARQCNKRIIDPPDEAYRLTYKLESCERLEAALTGCVSGREKSCLMLHTIQADVHEILPCGANDDAAVDKNTLAILARKPVLYVPRSCADSKKTKHV